MCPSAVRTEVANFSAMARFDSPAATSAAISRSRAVSGDSAAAWRNPGVDAQPQAAASRRAMASDVRRDHKSGSQVELFEDSVPADGGVGEDGRGQRGGEQGRRGAVPAVAGGWGLQGVDAGDDAMVEVAQGRRVRAGGGGEPEVALGIVGLELGLAIAASIWLQRRLGYRRWHVLHYLAYVAFALSLAHVIATSREVQALGMLGLAVFALAAACAPMALLRVLPATTAVATRITPQEL